MSESSESESKKPRQAPSATSTSSFGVSRRESHDASAFYERFTPPDLDLSTDVGPTPRRRRHLRGRRPSTWPSSTTTPSHSWSRRRRTSPARSTRPRSARATFRRPTPSTSRCSRRCSPSACASSNRAGASRSTSPTSAASPTGRLSPTSSGSSRTASRLLLRGEVIWHKARGAAGSCAWGSFQRPANPVLRDLTERVVIASKGRFDRALTGQAAGQARLALRRRRSFRDEFMESTTDVWEIPAGERHPSRPPRAVPGRPAPRGSSTSTPTAATSSSIRSWGPAPPRSPRCDPSATSPATTPTPAYVDAARRARRRRARAARHARGRRRPGPAPRHGRRPAPAAEPDEDFQARAVREGRAAHDLARQALEQCGFTDIQRERQVPRKASRSTSSPGTRRGDEWHFDVSGGFTSSRPGLKRTDTLWKALGKAAVLHEAYPQHPARAAHRPTRPNRMPPATPRSACCAARSGRSATSSSCAREMTSNDSRGFARQGRAGRATEPGERSRHRRLGRGAVAVAIVHSDPPEVLLASNADVLSRLVALKVVAQTDPRDLDAGARGRRFVTRCSMTRWADAVVDVDRSAATSRSTPIPTKTCGPRRASTRRWRHLEIRLQRIFDDD